jgi:hypothetical protein
MMVKAKGGKVWHKKDKKLGHLPVGLTGIDKQATWSYSRADGWIYGHGTFCLSLHRIPLVGLFYWMENSASESKRLETEVVQYGGLIETVCMDSKADDEKMYSRLKRNQAIKLLTVPRRKMDKSAARKLMIAEQMKEENRTIYRQRKVTVEPMQALVKAIFGLEECWMRGNESNRWAFAAMGAAVQVAQFQAYQQGLSTWKIKQEVLGL